MDKSATELPFECFLMKGCKRLKRHLLTFRCAVNLFVYWLVFHLGEEDCSPSTKTHDNK